MVGLAKLLADAWTRCRFWSHRALARGDGWCRRCRRCRRCRNADCAFAAACLSHCAVLRVAPSGAVDATRHRVGVYHPCGLCGLCLSSRLAFLGRLGRRGRRSRQLCHRGDLRAYDHRRAPWWEGGKGRWRHRRTEGAGATSRVAAVLGITPRPAHAVATAAVGAVRAVVATLVVAVMLVLAPRRAHGVRVSAEAAAAAPVPGSVRDKLARRTVALSTAEFARSCRWCCWRSWGEHGCGAGWAMWCRWWRYARVAVGALLLSAVLLVKFAPRRALGWLPVGEEPDIAIAHSVVYGLCPVECLRRRGERRV